MSQFITSKATKSKTRTFTCCPLILLVWTSLVGGLCCDVAVTQINYLSLKHNTQDSTEQARGRFHEEGSSQIFMLDDMQFGGGLEVI